jgi:hypothetical protein
MANTAALRYKVEPWVRSALEERYGQPFSSQVLELSPGGRHEFDAVSEDGTIVVSIKTNSGLTSGGKFPAGKVSTVTAELYYLMLVDAREKILVLTNREFHEILLRHLKGAVPSDITVMLMALPDELQVEVDATIAAASREMTPADVAEAVSTLVEAEADATNQPD